MAYWSIFFSSIHAHLPNAHEIYRPGYKQIHTLDICNLLIYFGSNDFYDDQICDLSFSYLNHSQVYFQDVFLALRCI